MDRWIRIDIFCLLRVKAWCDLWYSSHNEILTPLSWCPNSGYLKSHWGLELILPGKPKYLLFLLGTNHFIKHSGHSYRGYYFITRGNRISFDLSGYAHFISEDIFWMNFSTGDDVIGNFPPNLGSHWGTDTGVYTELWN